jgi:hypothetical protein
MGGLLGQIVVAEGRFGARERIPPAKRGKHAY